LLANIIVAIISCTLDIVTELFLSTLLNVQLHTELFI